MKKLITYFIWIAATIIISIMLAIAVLFVFYQLPSDRQMDRTVTSSTISKWDYYTEEGEVTDYIKLSDHILLAEGTSSAYTRVSDRYLTATSVKISPKSYQTGRYEKWDFAQLSIYDTDQPFQKKAVRTVDLKEKLSQFSGDQIYAGHKRILKDEESGDYYLVVHVIDKNHLIKGTVTRAAQYKNSYPIYLNLRTETFETTIRATDSVNGQSYLGNIYSTEVTNLYELTDRGSTIFVSDNFASFHSNLTQSRIYTQYFLDKYSVKDSDNYRFYWFGKPNSKIPAQLLAADGQTDIFQGVTLYGAYSKDGQDHVVQSYDELMSWYQEPAETETPASSAKTE